MAIILNRDHLSKYQLWVMLWKSARNSLRLNIHVLNSLGFLQHNYNIFVNLEESTSVKLFAPRARYTPQGKNENKQRLENVLQKRPCCMIWALLAWRLAYSYSIMFVRLPMIHDLGAAVPFHWVVHHFHFADRISSTRFANFPWKLRITLCPNELIMIFNIQFGYHLLMYNQVILNPWCDFLYYNTFVPIYDTKYGESCGACDLDYWFLGPLSIQWNLSITTT